MHCYLQERGAIAWLICVILGPTLLIGNYVKLCSVIFSFSRIYDPELIKKIRVLENATLKRYFLKIYVLISKLSLLMVLSAEQCNVRKAR